MTWTYSLGDLDTNPVTQVHFHVGDTDTNEQLIQDEEITYLLEEYDSNVFMAAAMAAEHIAAKFARLVNKSVGSLSLSYSNRADQYRRLAQSLRSQSAVYSITIPLPPSLVPRADESGDVREPIFFIGITDNPEWGGVNSDLLDRTGIQGPTP